MHFRRHKEANDFLQEVRNFIFGVEDSLVSTVGLLSGVATAGTARETIIMTGSILLFVEAFSMGIGSYLSERATREFGKKKVGSLRSTVLSSVIMVVSYFGAGLIPLSPYVLFDPVIAFPCSIAASLLSLAILGVVSAEVLRISIAVNTLRMFLMGGMAIALGVAVGALFT